MWISTYWLFLGELLRTAPTFKSVSTSTTSSLQLGWTIVDPLDPACLHYLRSTWQSGGGVHNEVGTEYLMIGKWAVTVERLLQNPTYPARERDVVWGALQRSEKLCRLPWRTNCAPLACWNECCIWLCLRYIWNQSRSLTFIHSFIKHIKGFLSIWALFATLFSVQQRRLFFSLLHPDRL